MGNTEDQYLTAEGGRLFNPPAVIDVEASGFGADSYPIELGVVLSSGKRLSMLIQPEPHWTHWDPQAEALHGLSPDLLRQSGKCVRTVAEAFNAFLAGQLVYSDAWVVDKPWINTLFEAAHMPLEFAVSPLEQIMVESQIERWDQIKQQVVAEYDGTRHRASIDALIIQETFMRSRDPVSLKPHGTVRQRSSANANTNEYADAARAHRGCGE